MRSCILWTACMVLPLMLLTANLSAVEDETMVITILEAGVQPNRAADLEREYRERITELPPQIVQTFLVRDSGDSNVFRIVTVWRARRDLEEMRASGVTPTGVLIFQAAGAKPTLSVMDVVVHRTHGRSD